MSPNATEEKSSLRCQGWGAGVETLLGVMGEVQACLLHVVIRVSPVSGGLAPACRLEKVLMQNISVHGRSVCREWTPSPKASFHE